jgi:hypothetical protein
MNEVARARLEDLRAATEQKAQGLRRHFRVLLKVALARRAMPEE